MTKGSIKYQLVTHFYFFYILMEFCLFIVKMLHTFFKINLNISYCLNNDKGIRHKFFNLVLSSPSCFIQNIYLFSHLNTAKVGINQQSIN
jgi:hypothetical protein